MSEPVTVAVTRRVPPGREAEMTSWVQAGVALAGRFPGFLGAGWVRSGADLESWHMLYRFRDHAALAAWEGSGERTWWRDSAAGLGVTETRVERRTGIEGWFDEPHASDVRDLGAAPTPAPPRWKQACVIWLTFFPLSLLAGALLLAVLPGLPLVPRTLLSTLMLTPVMTYLALPFTTRRLAWWLAGEPPPWRSRRSVAAEPPMSSEHID